MSAIVPVELPTGEVILAEVSSTGGDVGVLDSLRLKALKPTLTRLGRWLSEDVLSGLPDPDRYSVAFGMTLAVESGELIGVLAHASAEATVTVTMEWDRKPPAGGG
jgi:NTP-dependent ternary system trypsin peptidase co-occuring protein